jgi:hypothetical protein
MRRKALLCVALALLCSCAVSDTVTVDLPTNAAQTDAKHTVVMLYEPQLSTEYADVIHPYAFSHKMPDPHYDDHINAYNIADPSALSSFVETQTHIKAHSQHASTLKVAAEAEGWRRKPPTYNKKGYSTKLGFKKANNPATPNLPKKLKPLDSDFLTVDRTVAYRRASYGFRRRRIPNFGSYNPFRSLNPWHRRNSFVNMPNDMFGLPNAAIHNPRVFDFGRARAGMLPFGRVSSFTDNGAPPGSSSQSGSSSGSSGGSAGPAGTPPAPSLPAMPFMLDVFSDGFSGFRNGGYRQALSEFGGGFGGGFGGPYGNMSPVSPYIPGDDYRFRDFYGGGGGGSSESSF